MEDAAADLGAVVIAMRKLCDGDNVIVAIMRWYIVYIANYSSVEVALYYSLLVHVSEIIARESLVSRQHMWNMF